jgi:Fe-coproporphyrin III synthase
MAATATLMLHLTGKCNLECKHCYMEGSPRRREVLPLAWVADALRVAPELGIATAFLTGGEPLMYPHFKEAARIAASVDGLKTTVCTNATMVRPAEAALFRELGVDVHVSIDGNAAYHDGFRAMRGAFANAERGVSLIVDAGAPLTIVTTISQSNFDQVDWIFEWVRSSGAIRLLVQPLLDLGRGAGIREHILTPEQLNSLILKTSDLANSSGGKIKASIIGGNKRFFLAHPCAAYVCNGGGCHRGVSAEIKKIVVREDGTILPEATNLSHKYAIGHVSEGDLGSLVQRYFVNGYSTFDRLCRATYDEFVPDWPDAIIPWDQLLSLRSHFEVLAAEGDIGDRGCGSMLSMINQLEAGVATVA